MISIITVAYNQRDVTLEFLQSLEDQDYRSFEVIVVDNGSSEDFSVVNKYFPDTVLIRSEENLGFAGGNNLGSAAAKGDHFLFVNNDTEIPQGTLQRLLRTYGEHEDTGILCPLLYYHSQPDTLQYGGATPINPVTGRNHAIGYMSQQTMTGEVRETMYPHGAAMLISRAALEEIGPMPEDFFLYYEELDWAHRFRERGYRIRVDYGAHILHKESMSTGKASPLKTFYQTRNRILFMRRNSSRLHYFVFVVFFTAIAVPKNTLSFALKRQWDLMRAFFRGIRWHLPRWSFMTFWGAPTP